ncbi:MAG: homoserine dehydrogenase [Hyphomicrobiales bacterium]|nr:homoserine dehydrogenase [Hyphomicrobiales bacterium]
MTQQLRLGIAGLGTVGVGVLDLLEAHAGMIAGRCGRSVVVTAVGARSRTATRGHHDLSKYTWFDDPVALAQSEDIDVFVELIGGEEGPAKDAVEAALKAGKHVVTANKALLAHHGSALAELAETAGVALNFEAAVAGGIPIVKMMRESLAGNQVQRVFGILNGTCNYILTQMEAEGHDFDDVLKEAQELGYAEADPAFDIGGFDAAHKVACLTSLAFGTQVDFGAIYIEGIEHITLADIRNAGDLGYKIKLLGVAVETGDGIEQRVHPTLVPKNSPIADVDGVFNAVAVKADFADDLMLEGRGAGGHPTASSVVSDICDIARGIVLPPFGVPASQLKPYKRARMRAHEGGYYVSLELYDRPGEVAAVATIFTECAISIESIVQRGPATGGTARDTAPFILITHDTLESAMRQALQRIEDEGHAASRPRMIRIERL